MLTEIFSDEIKLRDIFYFKWSGYEEKLHGPYLVIGWNRDLNDPLGRMVFYTDEKPSKVTSIVTLYLGDKHGLIGHFNPYPDPSVKFYISDAIFLQETL